MLPQRNGGLKPAGTLKGRSVTEMRNYPKTTVIV